MNIPNASGASPEDKQKALLERARKGVLGFLNDRGGTSTLGEIF
jgi:hypothetical protein